MPGPPFSFREEQVKPGHAIKLQSNILNMNTGDHLLNYCVSAMMCLCCCLFGGHDIDWSINSSCDDLTAHGELRSPCKCQTNYVSAGVNSLFCATERKALKSDSAVNQKHCCCISLQELGNKDWCDSYYFISLQFTCNTCNVIMLFNQSKSLWHCSYLQTGSVPTTMCCLNTL